MTSPNNDPWAPIQSATLQAPPVDPLRQMISSEQYIESLERKLGKLKGSSGKEPSAKAMIASLEQTRASQMHAFLRETSQMSPVIPLSFEDEVSSSYLGRKLRPERQALNPEEVAPLLREDELARGNQDSDRESSSAFSLPEDKPSQRNQSGERNSSASSSEQAETCAENASTT